MKIGDYTPWGVAQHVDTIGPASAGVWFVSTASHGGIRLDPAAVALMPAALRAVVPFAHRGPGRSITEGPRWFEEDCDWCLPVLAFPGLFPLSQICAAIECGLSWHGDAVTPYLASLPADHILTVARRPRAVA